MHNRIPYGAKFSPTLFNFHFKYTVSQHNIQRKYVCRWRDRLKTSPDNWIWNRANRHTELTHSPCWTIVTKERNDCVTTEILCNTYNSWLTWLHKTSSSYAERTGYTPLVKPPPYWLLWTTLIRPSNHISKISHQKQSGNSMHSDRLLLPALANKRQHILPAFHEHFTRQCLHIMVLDR